MSKQSSQKDEAAKKLTLHPDLAAAPGWDVGEDGRFSDEQIAEMVQVLNVASFLSLIARLGTTVIRESAPAESSGNVDYCTS